jgi:putative nucleotidyltransferase with HDIG domain
MDESANKIDQLLQGAKSVAGVIEHAGYQAWFVGGCVRDRLLDRRLKDIDIATNATPDQIVSLFPEVKLVGAKFGVALVRYDKMDYEVATFRCDGPYVDHRHPCSVSFGALEDDVRRRDFTINALFQNPETSEIVDLVGGLDDLKKGVLRCVGDPRERFQEDALRLLRAIRFATRFSFDIDPDTWEAMVELAHTIEYISPERQRIELTRIFQDPNGEKGLRLLDRSGLLHWVLPEVEVMKGFEQGRRYHPEGDVYEHTCLVLANVDNRTEINVWAALLHDVGKPSTFRRNDEGKITFYDHPKVGAELAEKILTRLRLPNDDIDVITQVIGRHMDFLNIEKMNRATLRRFLGAETIENDLSMHRADCLGSTGGLMYYDFAQQKMEEFANSKESLIPPMLINGRDLMELGIPAGPLIGKVLKEIQEKQLNSELNSMEEALEWVETNWLKNED